MLDFKQYTPIPRTVDAIQLTEKLWRSLRRNGNEVINGNIFTAFEANGKKLFFVGDDFDLLKEGCAILHIGEWLVQAHDKTYVYTDEEFHKLYY